MLLQKRRVGQGKGGMPELGLDTISRSTVYCSVLVSVDFIRWPSDA